MSFQLVEKMLSGDRRALARLLTLVEAEPHKLPSVMSAIHGHGGKSYCVGVTGPPGAGKSTIVHGLVRIMRGQGVTVGILAVDPTSPFSGGAVLGDRVRMQQHYLDPGVFIRSFATRNAHGGLSQVAGASVKLLDAFGKDMIIVETVGVGQTELDITTVADSVVVTLVPEAGDGIQTMKAGLMEIGDIFVVNKADRPGAPRLMAAIKAALALDGSSSAWRPPVLLTQAHNGDGVQTVHEKISEHRDAMKDTPGLERRYRERRKSEFAQTLSEAMEARIIRLMMRDGPLRAIAERVESGELDPYSAAALAMDEGLPMSQSTEALGEGR